MRVGSWWIPFLAPVGVAVVGIGCGGSPAPAAAPAARSDACAVPVELANHGGAGGAGLEAHARSGAHSALVGQHACARPLSLAFALDAPADEPGALRVELHLGVSERGSLVASSSVTLRIPKPASDADVANAVSKAAGVLTRDVVAKLTP